MKKPVNLKAPKFSGQTMWKNLWISGTLVNSWWDVVKNHVNLTAPKISIWNLWKNLRISHTGLYNIIILWWGIGWCKLKKLRIARRFIRNFSLWSACQNLWIANATISSLGDMWKACYLDRKWPMKKKNYKNRWIPVLSFVTCETFKQEQIPSRRTRGFHLVMCILWRRCAKYIHRVNSLSCVTGDLLTGKNTSWQA